MSKIKLYSDEEFFNCKYRGATSIIDVVFGNPIERSLEDLTAEDRAFREIMIDMGASRGSAVHQGIEKWLDNDMTLPLDFPAEYYCYQEQFEKWLAERTQINHIEGSEIKLISDKYHIKGIIDCCGNFSNYDDGISFNTIVDWKTSSKLDLFRVKAQLQLYYILLQDQIPAMASKIDQLRCLQLTKNEYRWFKFDIDTKLGEAILYLYETYFRKNAEMRK